MLSSTFVWVVTHWDAIVQVAMAVHALAVAIINLTPTPRNDEGDTHPYYRSIEMAAGLYSWKAKD